VTLQTIDPAPGHRTARITYARPLYDDRPARYVGRHRRSWWRNRPFTTLVLAPIRRSV
jgi:hypothetical protein